MYNTNQHTIDKINDIIDNQTVDELYEERGHNFESEEYDRLVFRVTNYGEEPRFEQVVDGIVRQIESERIVVFDYYPIAGNDTWIIETSKD